MRLIDADAALKAFAAEYGKTKELIDSGETQLDSLAEGFTEAAHIVKHIVPTADAVPVVRCRDCVYSVQEEDGDLYCILFRGLNPDTHDCFCSYGKRKDET